jgi:hypothetical protein
MRGDVLIDHEERPMPVSKTASLLALVAAGVVAGGVATAALVDSGAAGSSAAGSSVTTHATTATTVADDGTAGDPLDAPADDGGDDGEDATGVERYWGDECGDGPPTNHGQYVAATPAGESRREAAQSPCGRPLSSVKVTTTTTTLPPEESSISTEGPAGTGNGHGNGNGRGNGGGNGGGPPAGKGGPKAG